MSRAKWSPEPWKLHTELFGREPFYEMKVADITGCGTAEADKDNARRIIACVNACQGIPTEALESGALGSALDMLLSCQQLAAGVAHASDVDRSEWTMHKGMAGVRMHQAYNALRALGRVK